MTIIPEIKSFAEDLTAIRHDLHAHPEIGFEEKRTGAFVARKLREFGLDEVVEGVGGTGVVATLRRGTSNRAIALRAGRVVDRGSYRDVWARQLARRGATPCAKKSN